MLGSNQHNRIRLLIIGSTEEQRNQLSKSLAETAKTLPPRTLTSSELGSLENQAFEFQFDTADNLSQITPSDYQHILFCCEADDFSELEKLREIILSIPPHSINGSYVFLESNETPIPSHPFTRKIQVVDAELKERLPRNSTLGNYDIVDLSDASIQPGKILLNKLLDQFIKTESALRSIGMGPAPAKDMEECDLNVLVIGSAKTGKTSLINNLNKHFVSDRKHCFVPSSANLVYLNDCNTYFIMKETNNLAGIDPAKFDVAIICFDLTQPQEFQHLSDQIKFLFDKNKMIQFMLVGNKFDLLTQGSKSDYKADDLTSYTTILSNTYPCNFFAFFSQSNTHPSLCFIEHQLKMIADKIKTIRREEKDFLKKFQDKYRVTDRKPAALERRHLSDSSSLNDLLIHAATKPNRAKKALINLGVFSHDGQLTASAPAIVRDRRRSMEIHGMIPGHSKT